MEQRNVNQNTRIILSLGILLIIIHGEPNGAPTFGASLDSKANQQSSVNLIRQAAHATDEAWEVFHQAAIGGTLASPSIQVKIEGQLHHIRSLLMEARKAERDNQVNSVKTMTQRIFDITHIIVQASRERKL